MAHWHRDEVERQVKGESKAEKEEGANEVGLCAVNCTQIAWSLQMSRGSSLGEVDAWKNCLIDGVLFLSRDL